MDEALYTCRFVQFAAAMLIFGTASFRIYALAGGQTRSASSILAGFDAWVGHVLPASALVALISALALVLCQTVAMAGSPAAAIDPATVAAVMFETRFGRVWCWHLLLALILVLVCLSRHPSRPVVLILSLALLASLGWVDTPLSAMGPLGSLTRSIRPGTCWPPGCGSAGSRHWHGFSGRCGDSQVISRFLWPAMRCAISRIWDTWRSRSLR
jgi:putative copper resistance protein D